MSVISEATAKKLGLRPVARGGLARAVGGGGKFEIVYGFLSSLELGDVKVESVPVYIRHFYDVNPQVDGYLGLSVISKFIAAVDYGDSTFSLRRNSFEGSIEHDSRHRSSSGSRVANEAQERLRSRCARLRAVLLVAKFKIEGVEKPLNFIIDTGASVSVISEKLAEQEDLVNLPSTNAHASVWGCGCG